ncbi:hypothetical protein F4820DRAFT_468518 [Hypoxylon rubiginosum]|uniref:Uncharacterized protein n=1 Tax=Hypoxylon rubiginosum TaxID=110542 RepID=A0ACB9YG19_9PEZI|nr:hypothetical protein F4820DRAFT_468518 [Hypoxylon rubiginosum]
MAKTFTPDQQLIQMVTLIDHFQSKDNAAQTERLGNVLNFLGLSPTPAQISEELPGVLSRQDQFKSLPRLDQLQYMSHLYHWRLPAPRRSMAEEVTKLKMKYIMMLFPLISDFVLYIHDGNYNLKRDGSWFVWWMRKSPDLRMEGGATRRTVRADRKLLHQLLLPSSRPQPNSPSLPSDASTNPDKPNRSNTQPWKL